MIAGAVAMGSGAVDFESGEDLQFVPQGLERREGFAEGEFRADAFAAPLGDVDAVGNDLDLVRVTPEFNLDLAVAVEECNDFIRIAVGRFGEAVKVIDP